MVVLQMLVQELLCCCNDMHEFSVVSLNRSFDKRDVLLKLLI